MNCGLSHRISLWLNRLDAESYLLESRAACLPHTPTRVESFTAGSVSDDEAPGPTEQAS